MSYTEERVVKMTFDHAAFSKDISSTITALNKLDESLKFKNGDNTYKAFDNLTSSVKETNKAILTIDESLEKVKVAFSGLQMIGLSVMNELTQAGIRFGKSVYNNTLGQIISGGKNRALNLEAAKFQLEGMKVEWDSISSDISYAVEDTAYGLDAAAKVASQLTASNISVGADMKNALRAISGVAAMTNSSYENIGHIFTTVASNGKLMTMQMRQLSTYGLNVSASMVKYYKEIKGMTETTEQSINDMVTKGKVSFKEFAEAMDYAFGEHAKEANRTFTGALSNMKAALSRIGELFQTPYLNFLKDIYNDLIPVINAFKKGISAFIGVYEMLLAKMAAWIHDLTTAEDLYYNIANILAAVYSWARAVYIAAYEAGVKLPNIYKILSTIREVTRSLVLEGEKFEKVKNILRTIINYITIWQAAKKAIIYAFEPLLDLVKKLFGITSKGSNGLLETLDRIAFIIKGLLFIGAKAIRTVLESEKFFNGLSLAIEIVSVGIKGLIAIFITLFEIISSGFNKVKAFFSTLEASGFSLSNIVNTVGNSFITMGTIIASVFSGAGTSAKSFFSLIGGGFSSLFSNLKKSSEETTKATKDTQTAIISATKTGFTGGKFIRGHSGGGSLVDLNKVSDQLSTIKDQQDDLAKGPTSGTGEVDWEMVYKVMPFLRVFDEDTLNGALEKIVNNFSRAARNLKKHLSNPMNLVKDAVVVAGIGVVTGIFVGIAKLISAAADAGKAANKTASANLMSSISKVLWSIAGVIFAMGVVSKYVDAENFKNVALGISAITAGFFIVLKALITMRKVATMADTLKNVGKMFIRLQGNFTVTVKQIVASTAEIFHEIVRLVFVVGASIIAMVVISKKFDISMGEFAKAAAIIGVTVLTLVGSLLLLSAIFKRSAQTTSKAQSGLSFKRDFFSRNIETTRSAVTDLIKSITPLIATLTVAILILGKEDPAKVIPNAAALIFTTVAMVGLIMSVMALATKYLYNERQKGQKTMQVMKDNAIIEQNMDTFMKQFTKMAVVISAIMAKAALSIKIIGNIKPSKLWSAVGALVIMVSTLVGASLLVMTLASKMQGLNSESVSKILGQMWKIILTMTGMTLAIAGALFIISKIDDGRLLESAITFGAIMSLMAGVMYVMTISMKKIVEMATTMRGFRLNAEITKTFGMFAVLMAEVVGSIVVMTGVFIILSKCIDSLSNGASTLIASGAVIIGGLAVISAFMFAIAKMSQMKLNIANVGALIGIMGATTILLLGISAVIKILESVNWSAFEGSAKYLIGFAVGITSVITIMAVLSLVVSKALVGVIGISVIILAIGTLGIMLAAASYIFANSIEKLKDAFKDFIGIDWALAKDSMGNLKDTITIFIETMSQTWDVLAAAYIFGTAISMIGVGLKLLAGIDAETMKYVAEAMKAMFADMAGLNKLAIIAVSTSLLFGLIGFSLAAGAAGFLVFAIIIPKILDLIIPAIAKLSGIIESCKDIFVKFKDVLSKEELAGIIAGLLQMFLIGSLLGISASALAVSSAVFLAGAFILGKACDIYVQAITDLETASGILSMGSIFKNLLKNLGKLILVGLEMSVAAGVLLGGALGILASSVIGIFAAAALGKMFGKLYEVFGSVDLGKVALGCGELVVASILIGIASVTLSLAGIPFLAAMTLFGLGVMMLTANVAIFSFGIAALAGALTLLAEVNQDNINSAVETIVSFVTKLNEALSEAGELVNNENMSIFADSLLSFAAKLGIAAIILPISGFGLIAGAGLLYLAGKTFQLAFEQLANAFEVMNYDSINGLLNNLAAVTDQLSTFVGWFLLYSIPFSLGAGLFLAAAYLLSKGFQYLNFVVTTYDMKKIVKKVEPIKDVGKMFLEFSAYIFGGSALLAIGAVAISAACWLLSAGIELVIPQLEALGDAAIAASEKMMVVAKNAEEAGKYTADGFAYGITLGHPEILDSASNIVTDFLDTIDFGFGINSPAKELIKRGLYIMQGLEKGIEEGEGGVEKATESACNDTLSIFDKFKNWAVDKLSNTGLLAGNGFGSNLYSSITSWVSKSGGAIGGLENLVRGFLNLPTTQALSQAVSGYQKSAMEAKNHGSQSGYDYYMNLAKEAEQQKNLFNTDGASMLDKIKQLLGLDDASAGLGGGGGGYTPDYGTGSGLAENLNNAGKGSSGKGIGGKASNLADSAQANIGNTITTNNNYNFVQNNYSPEPIDRTELYAQTQNQLNTWYKWLGQT